jgi:hypothetical protein
VNKAEFDHLIAAAAMVSEESEIVVIGSQAILGNVANPPEVLLRSIEADVYPLRYPDRAEEIDGLLGDGSPFHQTYGYYAHGVGPETAKAPTGWEERLVRVAVPKRPVAENAIAAGLLEPAELSRRIDGLPIAVSKQERVRSHLEALRRKHEPSTEERAEE